jgi:hypothetical protein
LGTNVSDKKQQKDDNLRVLLFPLQFCCCGPSSYRRNIFQNAADTILLKSTPVKTAGEGGFVDPQSVCGRLCGMTDARSACLHGCCVTIARFLFCFDCCLHAGQGFRDLLATYYDAIVTDNENRAQNPGPNAAASLPKRKTVSSLLTQFYLDATKRKGLAIATSVVLCCHSSFGL